MTPEVLARPRRQIHQRRLHVGPGHRSTTITVDLDDLQALIDAHDQKPFAMLVISPDLTDADFERLRLRWKEFADGIF